MYARGILFGKMKYELGDHSFVRCPELDLTADVDFKTKGWVGGTYNAIGGVIKRESTGEVLYELSGMWHEEMFIKNVATGHREMFFDAKKARASSPQVRPIHEQEERESQRLWEATAKAVVDRNHELATDEKTKIEDRQREEAAARAQQNKSWQPRLFRRVHPEPGNVEEGEEDLEWIIDAHMFVMPYLAYQTPANRTISDTSASPDEQAKQIMDIYPVLDSKSASEQRAASTKPPSEEAKPADASGGGNDLIDFGDSSAPSEPSAPQTKNVENMLAQTGKPADGPLLDFSDDMKKDLP
ncbi:Oxysterol-binding protein OBPa [Lecanicillium sp. MT-2017a]|nr:Oxysterol-binding protein OBPa [Lecanicillium sp. MT-2017a]